MFDDFIDRKGPVHFKVRNHQLLLHKEYLEVSCVTRGNMIPVLRSYFYLIHGTTGVYMYIYAASGTMFC